MRIGPVVSFSIAVAAELTIDATGPVHQRVTNAIAGHGGITKSSAATLAKTSKRTSIRFAQIAIHAFT
jgi:hypothetical protein